MKCSTGEGTRQTRENLNVFVFLPFLDQRDFQADRVDGYNLIDALEDYTFGQSGQWYAVVSAAITSAGCINVCHEVRHVHDAGR